MIKAGATLTWEHWYPHDGTHSHPWASTPASAIASGLMGVRPLSPGWETWLIKPAPGNLTVASIVVPTVRGSIRAKYTRSENGGLTLELNVPEATRASVCLPLFGAPPETAKLLVDGKERSTRAEDGGRYLCVDDAGTREVQVALVM